MNEEKRIPKTTYDITLDSTRERREGRRKWEERARAREWQGRDVSYVQPCVFSSYKWLSALLFLLINSQRQDYNNNK